MAKIDREVGQAFKYRKYLNKGNTVVTSINVILYRTEIARYNNTHTLLIRCGDYPTNTTRNRLNGILEAFGLTKCNIKNGVMYWNDMALPVIIDLNNPYGES